jgi:hypothetical protein
MFAHNLMSSFGKKGDGFCDYYAPYNTAACGYDGGDCCEDTCGNADFICGEFSPYFCLDPSSTVTLDPLPQLPVVPDGCDVDDPGFLGDGWCDYGFGNYNTPACGWDLGDCCEESCTASDFFQAYTCGTEVAYACFDPDYGGPGLPEVTPECQQLFEAALDFVDESYLGTYISVVLGLFLL